MHTILPTVPNERRAVLRPRRSVDAFREPAHECEEGAKHMKLVVYLPGVAAAGVEIEGRDADLTLVARKARFVRVNFPALHLEGAQRDYRLRLRLGTGVDFASMEAEMAHGVLTITLPKRTAPPPPPFSRVAGWET